MKKVEDQMFKVVLALQTFISKEYIEHVHDVKLPKQLWGTLERLYAQKNTICLQFLENEISVMTQGNLSIRIYFEN